MAKKEQMLRLQYIEDFLRRRKDRGANYEEIEAYLQEKFEEKDLLPQLNFTKRTFSRDKDTILEVSGIEISFCRRRKAYYIENEELAVHRESVFDNLLLVQAYREAKSDSNIMLFEQRISRGLDLLNGLIHAIKHSKIITFTYRNFWKDEPQHRVMKPVALKEFRQRWYLLASESRPGGEEMPLRTFGLDRMSDLEISGSSFAPLAINVDELFKDAFGIIAPNTDEPATAVRLWFDEHQAKYIKALPLHHSQKVVAETETGVVFEMFLAPTYDFRQEILSFGTRCQVLSPPNLIIQIKQEIEKMTQMYEHTPEVALAAEE